MREGFDIWRLCSTSNEGTSLTLPRANLQIWYFLSKNDNIINSKRLDKIKSSRKFSRIAILRDQFFKSWQLVRLNPRQVYKEPFISNLLLNHGRFMKKIFLTLRALVVAHSLHPHFTDTWFWKKKNSIDALDAKSRSLRSWVNSGYSGFLLHGKWTDWHWTSAFLQKYENHSVIYATTTLIFSVQPVGVQWLNCIDSY